MQQTPHPSHLPGQTSGSPQRPAQTLTGQVLVFNIQDELARLRDEPAWQRGGRNAITLVKESDFRVTLTALKPDVRVQEHHVDARLTLQVVAGRLRLRLPQETVDLAAGQVVALEGGVVHDVEALEECGFLLTIAWPPGTRPSDAA